MNHSFVICGETHMADCARLLAGQLRGGECILLFGTLGAGKTTFARGLVRALCGEALEVVSPTFMLMQHYDALPEHGAFPLQHYDLYRLEDAGELWELGIDEVLGHALVLVEWPEVAAGHWPENRLEMYFTHEAENSGCRRLQLTARGDMVRKMQLFLEEWERFHRD